MAAIGRNDPCACNSGKKYKKCCGGAPLDPQYYEWVRWRGACDRVNETLAEFASSVVDKTAVNVAKQIFGLDQIDGDRFGEYLTDTLVTWLWFHYPGQSDWPRKGPLARIFLDEVGQRAPADSRTIIESQLAAPFSFFQILATEPSTRQVSVRDLFTDEEATVWDEGLANSAQPGYVIYTKRIEAGGIGLFAGTGMVPLRPLHRLSIDEVRRARLKHKPWNRKNLETEAERLRKLYFELLEASFRGPQLCNTDGEPLAPRTLHYRVSDFQTAWQALHSLALDEADALVVTERDGVESVQIPWRRQGTDTVYGHLKLSGRELTVEVNSEGREHDIRVELEQRLRGGLELIERKAFSPEEYMDVIRERAADDPQPGLSGMRPPDEAPPEFRAALKSFLARHWEKWFDEPIPALGGLTPKVAAKTAAGRRKLEMLLEDYEVTARRNPGDINNPDVPALRKRLGLG